MEHLLIIEDDKVDQMAFERFAKKEYFPFTYQMVNSINKAKEILLTNKFDAIVSDFFLGDGTTFEILELNIDTPFIVITGTGSEEIAVKAIKKGAFDYIIKDIDGYYLKTLTVTVQNAIKHFKIQKENEAYHNNLEKLVQKRTAELNEEIEHRKIVEKEIRKLSVAVEQSPTAITITDLEGNIEYVNSKFINLTGYTLAEIKGKNPRILKSGAQSSSFYKKMWETIIKGKHWKGEFQNKRKNGELYWTYANISPILDTAKNIINYVSISEDITERKKMTLELQESEQNLLQAQEIAQLGSYILNLNTQIASCSKTFFSLTELDITKQLSFKQWRKLVHPEDIEINNKILQESIKNKGNYNHIFRIITKKTKTLKWLHSQGKVFDDKTTNTSYFKGVIQDITKRKHNEQIQTVLFNISNAVGKTKNVKQLISFIQNELASIIDTTNFYIALYDKENNKITLPFFSDEKDSFKNIPFSKTLTNFVLKQKKSILVKKQDIKQLVRNKQVNLTGTIPEIWLGVPLHINGEVSGVIAVQNYTNPNAYTPKDKNILEFVSNQVGVSIYRKKTEENLYLALEKATESDRLKTAFLQNMSHEIRTPMNGILGFADLLRNMDLTPEKQQKYIEIITKSSNRLLNTLNDLMDISKLETGQVKLNFEKTVIYEELKNIFDLFNKEAANKGLQLELESQNLSKDLSITTDKNKLDAILMNLIKNAIKYSHQGIIKFGFIEKEKTIEFYVKDDGIGIPKSRQKAIFNRFVQADIEDKKVFEGAGLGLSLSKSYVTMLGGKIWVTSKVGEGSQFYFTIPKNANKSKPEATIKTVKKSNFENLKVLLVEDEIYAYSYLNILFTELKATTFHAKNGLDAVEMCKNNPNLDLILMDIKMPVMDGIESTQKIREFNKEVIIIAQTAYALQGDKEKTLEAGCNDFISKPIKSTKLIKLLNKYF
jgi:PAS domain S-box-containing protein